MRKPKIAICFLALATVLWAARPVALADEGDWLTLENAREAVETVPEPGEGSSEQSFPSWLGDPEEDSAAEDEPEPDEGSDWLTPNEAADSEEIPDLEEPEEEDWLTPNQLSEPEEPEKEEPKEVKPEEAKKTALDSGALIEVTVPANGEVIINPHRFPVTLGGREIRDQIINVPQLLTNRSDAPIVVKASVSVNTEGSGGLTVTGHPISEGETDKLAYLYVEFQSVMSEDAEAAWSGGYTGASNQLLVSDGGEPVEVLRMEAGETYASYRLFGSLTENPATGWQAGDKLSVTVSFTFDEVKAGEEAETAEEADEEAETAEEADEGPVEAEEISELKDKADAKPEEVPVIAPEPDPEPDPGPEPEPETEEVPLYEPAAVFEREEDAEEQREKPIEFFANAMNKDWMAPPDES